MSFPESMPVFIRHIIRALDARQSSISVLESLHQHAECGSAVSTAFFEAVNAISFFVHDDCKFLASSGWLLCAGPKP